VPLELSLGILDGEPSGVVGRLRTLVTDQVRAQWPELHAQVGVVATLAFPQVQHQDRSRFGSV
jgi:hypothetical protein